MGTQVVLARARRTGATTGRPSADGPPEVHAYRISEKADEAWESACGVQLAPRDAEIVDRFTGVPCLSCYLTAIMAADVTPITRTELEPPTRTVELSNGAPFPAEYAASWRERVVHLIATEAPRTELDDEPVIMGRCGSLGWPSTKPAGWDLCPECTQLTPIPETRPEPHGLPEVPQWR